MAVSVYVDEVRVWPTKVACFRKGSAHLTADTLDELHVLAESIGLRRAWFQDGRVPHYDLTPRRRLHALAAGADFVSAKDQARRRIAARSTAARTGCSIGTGWSSSMRSLAFWSLRWAMARS